ncbi:Leucine Rich Repeat [Fragilaria crotonensis]|nr:Leucine Rich Repeat [Fragilaria crotonensis]
MSPAVMANRRAAVEAWVVQQGYSSAESLAELDSPQSRAVEFMVESMGLDVPTESTSDESIAWMERYVLVVFYYSLRGEQWLDQSNFLEAANTCCLWNVILRTRTNDFYEQGASCDETSQRIKKIQFFGIGLAGSLPSELGLLAELESFIFYREIFLVESLPDTLQNLKKLNSIEFSGSSISGSLPSWIDQWTSMTFLSLSANDIGGSLPDSLASLTDLRVFAVDDNTMTGDLSVLEGLTKLTGLYIDSNGFTGTVDDTFLQDLSNLQILDASGNLLEGTVPVHLMGLPSLTILDIHDNQLTEFPDSIPANGSLSFLAFYDNPITGSFPTKTIGNLTELDHLDLTSTGFTGGMPSEIGELSKLTYLFMAGTNFTAGSIPEEYQGLTNLVDLSLKRSGRTGLLPTWLKDLDRLVLLDLDFNEFTGKIPSEIGNMVSLEFLFLNRNQLEGNVPTELGFVSSLQALLLDGNPRLTGNLSLLCEELVNLDRDFVRSDCGAVNTTIICSCCTCCDPNNTTDCDYGDELAQYDPNWQDNFDRGDYYLLYDGNITRF